MGFDEKKVYLLLGSNLGDKHSLIADAITKIAEQVGTVFAQSALYETEAWGKEDQPSFINAAIGVKTGLQPLQVLEKVLGIEQELGRTRMEKWGARLIDIDIILFDDEVVNEPDHLQIPHPQMQYRRFVLEPLAEIAPAQRHPLLQLTVSELLQNLEDNLTVSKI